MININDGFSIGSSVPADSRLTLSKAEMKAMSDAVMPEVYLCVCLDDGLLYTYNKTNEVDETTGKFRVNASGVDFESYTDEEIGQLFDYPPEEVEEMKNFISDSETSQYKVWSSKKTSDEIVRVIAENGSPIDDEADNTSEDKTWSAKKISDEIVDLESMIDGVYTTEEKVIGKWVDGKPIYRQVFELSNIPNDFNNQTAINIPNFKVPINVYGYYNSDAVSGYNMIGQAWSTNSLGVQFRNGTLCTYNTGGTISKAVVIVEYTKDTD